MKLSSRVPLVVGGLIVVLAGLGYYLNMMLIPDLKMQEALEQQKRVALQAKVQELAAVQVLDSNYSEIESKANLILSALPSDKQIPDILFQLTSIADEYGLVDNSLAVSPTPSGSARSSVQSIDFNLTINGRYDKIIAYLSKIEQSLRLINIDSVSLSGSSSADASAVMITASLKGRAFMTPAPKATTGGPAL